MNLQRGGFVLGLVVGLLVGLALALGVALYITKAPIPFINKVPPRTSQQDMAETERNRNWDPNAALAGKAGKAASAASAAASSAGVAGVANAGSANTAAIGGANTTAASAAKPGKDPSAILAAGADAASFFVQTGAYTSADEAEQQRAKLALSGFVAKVSERDQAGRVVHRVRLGPFDKREDADAAQSKLIEAGVEARLVRVER